MMLLLLISAWVIYVYGRFYSAFPGNLAVFGITHQLLLGPGIVMGISVGLAFLHFKTGQMGHWITRCASLLLFIAAVALILFHPHAVSLLLFTGVCWYYLGRWFLARIQIWNEISHHRTWIALAAGMPLNSLLVLGLGLWGHLSQGYLLGVLGVIVCLGLLTYGRKDVESTFKNGRSTSWGSAISWLDRCSPAFSVLLSAYFLILTLGNIAPPPSPDDLAYHLPTAQRYVSMHRIAQLPDISHSNLPGSAEMIDVQGFLLGSDHRYSGLINILFSILLLCVFQSIASRLKVAGSGTLAFLMFLSVPYFIFHGFTRSADLKFLLYCLLAWWALLEWFESRKPAWIKALFAFSGMTLGFRYHGAILVFVVCWLLFFDFVKYHPTTSKPIIRMACVGALLGLAIGSPWYVKSWVYTGNPLFPASFSFLNGVYGDPDLSLAWKLFGDPNYPLIFGHYGFGCTLLSYLKLPERLTFLGTGFEGYPLTPVFLAFLPMAVFVRARQTYRTSLAFAACYLTVWFFQMQQMKFLMPVWAVLSLAAAGSIFLIPTQNRWVRTLCFSVALFPAILSLGSYLRTDFILDRGRIVLQQLSQEEFLKKNFSAYPLTEWVNQNIPPNGHIFAMSEGRFYYLHRPYTLGFASDQVAFDYRTFDTLDNFLARLKQENYTHLIYDQDPEHTFGPILGTPSDAALCYLISQFETRWIKPLATFGGTVVAEIHYPPGLKAYDAKHRVSPMWLGDFLYAHGKLLFAERQYEQAVRLGVPGASTRLSKMKDMTPLDEGNYYVDLTKQFRNDFFLKAALDAYDRSAKTGADPTLIASKRREVYALAIEIVPHIWGKLGRFD